MPKKKVGSVHTAKNGSRYKIMPNGRARFISGPTKRAGGKKKGAGMYGHKKGGVIGYTRANKAISKGRNAVMSGVNNAVNKFLY